MPAIDRFSPAVRAWFTTTFAAPTPAQEHGWPAIASGDHTLILAPTGSGKTLTAFLWALDRLMTDPVPDKHERQRVLYLSPLRALAVDVERNLQAPLRGIELAAERLGMDVHLPTVGVRSGDTSAADRRRLVSTPPDILITTPESLYLYLTSQARSTLTSIRWVIIDEIHAMAATKRGSHLALSLERLEELTDTPVQRIGLSATQRPLEEIARFLGGFDDAGRERPVTLVDAGVRKELDIQVVVPVEDMGELGQVIDEPAHPGSAPARRSIWPAVHPRLLDLVESHTSTLIFVNARRMAERLAAQLNELARERHAIATARAEQAGGAPPPRFVDPVKAHHGSLAREQRLLIEDELKSGRLRGLVATSSLELGIDMGAVDLVVQVESPGAVSRGLQRIGRAGHQVGEPSRGRIFPKYRGDLLETAVVVQRMQAGLIESTHYPRNPLDVLAQQIVAASAMDEWSVADLLAMVRRSASFHDLADEVFHAVLDLLAGRFPSDEFSELRPRIVWDRVGGTIRGRPGAQRLAVTNPGTIPDRGLFGVFLPDGTRVGELDEEMVHESRPGETFILGASTWRIEDVTHERVVVTPAPGEPGKMPFWHGDGPGRPAELGAALGAFVREVHAQRLDDEPAALARLRDDHALDPWAAGNVLSYLAEQAAVTGALPDDRTIVVERFRDEIGDWRICLLSPYGAQVHAPWAMAIEATLTERGFDPEVMWADDGIVLRLEEASDELPMDALVPDPDTIESVVVAQLAGTSLFTTIFREAAGRALLLPKRRPGERTALWQQRQKAANLLKVASVYPTFPITLEATRECLQDIFDLPALTQLLRDITARKVRLIHVDTEHASPFARSLLFDWVATYMYEYDAPLAERRAAALSLDRDLLRELLGSDELRDLIDPEVLADLELELQRLVDGRRARSPDELHDVLRDLGSLTVAEVGLRSEGEPSAWIDTLISERRAIRVRVADEERLAAAEDASRLRDALGVALPPGLPAAFTDPVARPLEDLVSQYARTHGPFHTGQLARRLGAPEDRVRVVLEDLEQRERVEQGGFRPGGVQQEWVEVEVLRRLRRRSLAALRREVEPVEAGALTRYLTAWHGIDRPRRGVEGLTDVLAQLQGAPIPASVLESSVLVQRLHDYRPADLDQLCATGELVWIGAGSIGANDGRVVLCFRDQAHLLAPTPPEEPPNGEVHDALRRHLEQRGASFWPDLLTAAGVPDESTVLEALWDLVWAGEASNDTLAPLRARTRGKRKAKAATGRPRPGRLRRVGPPDAAGRWSLVAPLLQPRPSPTELAHARAEQLLERYGVVTRETARGEGLPGGFAGVYPVLKLMEESGRIRRGYFVEGLGAAQFALPGAVDRLRDHRETPREPSGLWLAATDPAQPCGAAIPWPPTEQRPARAAGAYVLFQTGEPAAYLERGGRSLITFPAAADGDAWLDALRALVKDGHVRRIELARIDGGAASEHDIAPRLRDAGFGDGYRGLTLRA